MYLSDPILYLMVPFHAMVNYQTVLWIYGYKQAFCFCWLLVLIKQRCTISKLTMVFILNR